MDVRLQRPLQSRTEAPNPAKPDIEKPNSAQTPITAKACIFHISNDFCWPTPVRDWREIVEVRETATGTSSPSSPPSRYKEYR